MITNFEIYNTTNDELIVNFQSEWVPYEFYFSKTWIKIPAIAWAKSNKLRSDSQAYSIIRQSVEAQFAISNNYTKIDEIYGYSVLMNKSDYKFYIDVNWDMIEADNTAMAKFKVAMAKKEELKLKLASITSGFWLWDRVCLYWPTGTGKTFDFLGTANQLKKDWHIDEIQIVTITEWYEDIDFLAHIIPTTWWIKHEETEIFKALKRASTWTKMAILLDELNRWSKSFLNLMLKLLDAVDWQNYIIQNYLTNETLLIPIQNVMFYATMNLGWKYVWTNALDEALLDRFNIVQYKGYNLDVEEEMLKVFWSEAKVIAKTINSIRDLSKDWEIRAPISTRWVKMWAEAFINSPKSKNDIMNTFARTILNRLTSVDDFGNPNKEEEAVILNIFKTNWLI